ncbi:MAG TPA: mercury(II) reductase [Anaerolineae bacterium]|nr:mercury(II) reductase [Anaerolineae bacterium]
MRETIQIELDVRGMTCPGCAQHVSRALAAVPGVQNVDVPGWQSSRATVEAAPDVADAALVEAVAAAGYRARIVARRSPAAGDGGVSQRETDFDLLVIGGGSGGFAAAIKGAELGARVGLINDGTLGGTCVNVGCVPSKALIRVAEAWYRAGRHPFAGVETRQEALDWDAVRGQKDALVSDLRREKYADVLAAYPEIAFIPGRAVFQADGTVRVGERVLRAGKYVVAVGARPRLLPIPGAAEAGVLTSTTLMDLPRLPQSLLVLGGRAVALELGQMMARFGVRVALLQRSSRLLPDHDPDIGRALKGYLEEEGIGVVVGVQVERIERQGDERVVHTRVHGRPQVYRAEQVLMALGRRPNTEGLGLAQLGVELDKSGAIVVDKQMRTAHPDIYATGDCTINPNFVYVAAAGGAIAAENALTGAGRALDLSAMPAVVFTDPQVATVGLTEAQAKAQGYDVRSSKLPLRFVPRALAARDTRGFIKLVADGTTGRLLGAHILAAEGGEVVQSAVLAVKFGLTIEDLTGTLFPYLTQVEGLKLAALTFDKDVGKLSCCAG